MLQSAYVCARCTSEKLQGAHTAAGATRHSATSDVQKSTLCGRAACRERCSVRDLQSTSAGCMRYDVRAVRTPRSRDRHGPGEDAQSKRQYGTVGLERLRRCRGAQPGVRRSRAPGVRRSRRRQRVLNALMGCGRPERSAPSCGIHTELGGRAEPLVAAPTDADHVLVSRANIFADDATGLDRHRKFSYGISTEHGTRPHSTAGEVPERTRPRCNTSTQTRTVRKKVSEPRTLRVRDLSLVQGCGLALHRTAH